MLVTALACTVIYLLSHIRFPVCLSACQQAHLPICYLKHVSLYGFLLTCWLGGCYSVIYDIRCYRKPTLHRWHDGKEFGSGRVADPARNIMCSFRSAVLIVVTGGVFVLVDVLSSLVGCLFWLTFLLSLVGCLFWLTFCRHCWGVCFG